MLQSYVRIVLCKHMFRHMRQQRQGSIVIVCWHCWISLVCTSIVANLILKCQFWMRLRYMWVALKGRKKQEDPWIHTHWVILNSLITITFWAVCQSFCENIVYVMISVDRTDAFTEGFLSSPCFSLKFGTYGTLGTLGPLL